MTRQGKRHATATAAAAAALLPACAFAADAQTFAGFLSRYPAVVAAAAAAVAAAVIVPVVLHMTRTRKLLAAQRAKEAEHRDAITKITETDALTGVYNERQFLKRAEAMLKAHPDRRFVMVRLDINRFQLVNAFFGADEGDRLLRYLADAIAAYAKQNPPCTFGRVAGDVFALCCPYDGEASAADMMRRLSDKLRAYPVAFRLVLTFGLYVLSDRTLTADAMLDRAALAAKSVKGNYATPYAYYTEDMSVRIEREQELVTDMPDALSEDQFCILIQPQYDLQTGLPSGGEALVRWEHPEKGVINPGEFIPVFEKNGLIMRLDAFVWEEACKLLRTWLDAGLDPFPLSVNVSRVNLYNPNIIDQLEKLVSKYDLPPRLLELEMTESAYTDNPQAMRIAVGKLRERGFKILMDDFGNGYSSLNILKDIDIDLLKIDMQFLSRSEIAGRGENIVASVVRMAKWLGLPVVAEGAETKEQVDFLHSIGCEYVQGYYFSKPVTPAAYLQIVRGTDAPPPAKDTPDAAELWASNAQLEALFSGASSAAALYEYDADTQKLTCIRVNDAFSDLFGYTVARNTGMPPLENAVGDYRDTVSEAIDAAVESRDSAWCEYLRHLPNGKNIWVDLKIKYINCIGDRHLLLGNFFDITAYKAIEQELVRFRSAMTDAQQKPQRMLIVDDQPINREILKKIFASTFVTFEAADGQQALDVLKSEGAVDVILLDMVMPVMDGEAFLRHKLEDDTISDIPVVIVTADDSAEKQINMLAIGAHDYIVKPLIPDVVRRRVNNVIESSNRFRTILREYQDVVEQAKADPLTRVYNRAAAEQMISGLLERENDLLHALVMIDLDDFKNINDTYGHSYGDMVLMEFGKKLTGFFRAGDIVARMGGDEFCVFMRNVRTAFSAQDKCQELCRSVRQLAIGGELVRVTCSIGVAVSGRESTFGELYRQADSALYASKRASKNRVTVFTEPKA